MIATDFSYFAWQLIVLPPALLLLAIVSQVEPFSYRSRRKKEDPRGEDAA